MLRRCRAEIHIYPMQMGKLCTMCGCRIEMDRWRARSIPIIILPEPIIYQLMPGYQNEYIWQMKRFLFSFVLANLTHTKPKISSPQNDVCNVCYSNQINCPSPSTIQSACVCVCVAVYWSFDSTELIYYIQMEISHAYHWRAHSLSRTRASMCVCVRVRPCASMMNLHQTQ